MFRGKCCSQDVFQLDLRKCPLNLLLSDEVFVADGFWDKSNYYT